MRSALRSHEAKKVTKWIVRQPTPRVGLPDWFCKAVTLAIHTGSSIAIATHVDIKERARSSKKTTVGDDMVLRQVDKVAL